MLWHGVVAHSPKPGAHDVKAQQQQQQQQQQQKQGRVVWKPVNVNPGLNVNWSIVFLCL